MKVIVNIGGRWKTDIKVHSLFEKYETRTLETMTMLSETLKFRLPRQLILRPLYSKDDLPAAYGKALFCPFKGYTIAMLPDFCMAMRDKGFWVLDHECVHIANAIKYNDWGHGRMFKTIYAMCRRGNNKKQKQNEA